MILAHNSVLLNFSDRAGEAVKRWLDLMVSKVFSTSAILWKRCRASVSLLNLLSSNLFPEAWNLSLRDVFSESCHNCFVFRDSDWVICHLLILVVYTKKSRGAMGMVLPKGWVPWDGPRNTIPYVEEGKGKKYSGVRKCRVILLSVSSTFVGIAQPYYKAHH